MRGTGATLELRVTAAAAGRVVVGVAGGLDLASAPELRHCLTALAGMGARDVVLDLGAVTFMDSAGLAVLVHGLRRLRQQGGELSLAAVPACVQTIVALAGLTPLFAVVETSPPRGET